MLTFPATRARRAITESRLLSRRLAAPLAASLLLASPSLAQTLDGHPFHALAPTTMPWGGHVLETGVEYRSSAVPVPIAAGHEGDLLKAPEIRYRIGFGRAELAIGGTGWQRFDPDSDALDDESENGDLSFWLSVGALEQRGKRPALGFAIGAKMPNASEWTGLGSDEADSFLAVLLGHAGEAHDLRLNIGMAILGDPADDAAQEDLMTYAVAGRHGRRHCFAWEVYGRAFDHANKRDLTESTIEAGYMFRGHRVIADISLLAGLAGNSGDIGASAGVAFLFGEAVR